jgi:hypothetical protein
MRSLHAILGFGAPLIAAVLGAASLLSPAQAISSEQVSLMKTLSRWKYPGSKMLDGASMSDGGNPLLQSVKCQAILTTSDPFEKVIEFYSKKLDAQPAPSKSEVEVGPKDTDAKSVATQDDSRGRPVSLRIIVVNKADTSTALVISRAAGESETHIAWSHYIRLDGKR